MQRQTDRQTYLSTSGCLWSQHTLVPWDQLQYKSWWQSRAGFDWLCELNWQNWCHTWLQTGTHKQTRRDTHTHTDRQTDGGTYLSISVCLWSRHTLGQSDQLQYKSWWLWRVGSDWLYEFDSQNWCHTLLQIHARTNRILTQCNGKTFDLRIILRKWPNLQKSRDKIATMLIFETYMKNAWKA